MEVSAYPGVNDLLDDIRQLADQGLDYKSLGKLLKGYDFSSLEWEELLPEITDPNDYARNILLLDPMEVVLLHWPPGVESGVHFHQGFYGYVVVLDGTALDIAYTHRDDDIVTDVRVSYCFKDGIIDEPDGFIHKIVNPDKQKRLVTMHFYHPALVTLEDLKIYDNKNGRIGVLSETAETASWDESPGHFKELRENAFTFKHYHELYPEKSHRIVFVKPKPDPDTIGKMISEYYDEQARDYDNFDNKHETRKAYTSRLNDMIASDLKACDAVENILSMACGTCRRAIDIREKSGDDFHIVGVDISRNMTEVAGIHDVDVLHGDIRTKDWSDYPSFDAATFLYAFGHLANKNEREETLKAIHDLLKPGAPLYLDLFHLNDRHEWGPAALKSFKDHQLWESGYERGDVFYQKAGGHAIAYLHYFEEDEIRDLLADTGFDVEWIKYIGYVANPGEVVDKPEDGFLFVKALKQL